MTSFRWAGRCWLLAVFGLTVGCGSAVRTESFSAFHAATRQYAASVDEAYESVYDTARADFLAGSPLTGNLAIGDLLLQWQDDAFAPTTEKTPLHLSVRDMRVGTHAINRALTQYSELLDKLAAAEVDQAERIDRLATEANMNLRSGADALKLDLGDRERGLISAVGAEVVRQRLRDQHRRFLLQTMGDADETIQSVAESMADRLTFLALNVVEEYQSWASRQVQRYDAADRQARLQILEEVLAYNDRVVELLGTIAALRDGYRSLASAHAALLASFSKDASALVRIRELTEDARRVHRLQQRLSQDQPRTDGEAEVTP